MLSWQEFVAGSNKGAVSSSGSTVHVVRAAEPVGLRAAASRAGCLIRSTLLLGGHLHEFVAGSKRPTFRGAINAFGDAAPGRLRAAATWAR
jgi:hypothetical protein